MDAILKSVKFCVAIMMRLTCTCVLKY